LNFRRGNFCYPNYIKTMYAGSMRDEVEGFIAERTRSLAHLFAFWTPSNLEPLPEEIGSVADRTAVVVKKLLHGGGGDEGFDPWVTVEL
jgi:hypothetical protein